MPSTHCCLNTHINITIPFVFSSSKWSLIIKLSFQILSVGYEPPYNVSFFTNFLFSLTFFLRNPFSNNFRWRIQFSYLHKQETLTNNTDLFLEHSQRIYYSSSHCDRCCILMTKYKHVLCFVWSLCANFASASFLCFSSQCYINEHH